LSSWERVCRAQLVSFSTTLPTFTVSKSSTYIPAAVPAGSTTGPVQVLNLTGTLTGTVNFQVLP